MTVEVRTVDEAQYENAGTQTFRLRREHPT
jgi:hypothetical protein